MEKERLQEYAARVTQANRSELVVIIYEATLASIEEGKNYLKQGEIEAARHEIERARSMITELMGSLDLQYEISHYLRQLYVFAGTLSGHRKQRPGAAKSCNGYF